MNLKIKSIIILIIMISACSADSDNGNNWEQPEEQSLLINISEIAPLERRESWTLAAIFENGCADIARIKWADIGIWIYSGNNWIFSGLHWDTDLIGFPQCDENIVFWEYLEYPLWNETIITLKIEAHNGTMIMINSAVWRR